MQWYENIHQEALRCSREYKRSEFKLILAIQKVDAKKVYRKLGYSSLFDYGVKALNLPEGTVYAFIRVSRKALELPKITAALQEGQVTVSQVKRVLTVMTLQSQDLWLEKAAHLTQRQLDQEVAKKNPEVLIPERIKPVFQNRLRLECGISDRLEKKLKRVREVLSQKLKKPSSLEDELEAMADVFLSTQDPLEKAKRALGRKKEGKVSRENEVNPKASTRTIDFAQNLSSEEQPASIGREARTPIPMNIRHQLFLRDHGTCSHVDPAGQRCESKRFLDMHHVVSPLKGGTNALHNLKLLCQGHHRLAHDR